MAKEQLTKKELEILDLVFYVGLKNIANSLNLDNAVDIAEKVKECKELHLKLKG